jgi:glycosyltransferase involved in cell wall biosynthesis
MSCVLIISPSGNFYGSEQVLYDYLYQTKGSIDLAVPKGSLFLRKLRESTMGVKLKPYNEKKLVRFYAGVFFNLLRGKYEIVYLNEAGHIRYIAILANLFPIVKFMVHVRLLEDTDAYRWKHARSKNMIVLAISQYIGSFLPVRSHLLYDCYQFSDRSVSDGQSRLEVLRIAIIGRITRTKGVGRLPEIVKYIDSINEQGRYEFYLYGEVSFDLIGDPLIDQLRSFSNVRFMGFEEDQDLLYRSVDCVMHLSTEEGLGRIYFEAIDRFKPFIGFKAGGIAEIGSITQLDEFLVDLKEEDMAIGIYSRLDTVRSYYSKAVSLMAEKKEIACKLFGIKRYNSLLSKLLT